RLCAKAQPKATYRVYLDHAAPFVGRTAASAACVTTADSVVAQTPAGHRGVGMSQIEGDTVRFVIPLAKLHVGKPRDVPRIALWATSSLGNVTDHAPNREAGDGCGQPQVTTEALVQARVALTGGIAFVSRTYVAGDIGEAADDAIDNADHICQAEATLAGITNTRGVHAWLANSYSQPANYADPSFGPIQLPDGTVVADNVAALMSCDQSGDPCLQAGINEDIQGNVVDTNYHIWTAALPNGTFSYDSTPSCGNWAGIEPTVGTIGNAGATNSSWTNAGTDFCVRTHYLYCIELNDGSK
ncbi:MAG: hypothetical protein WAS21_13000, partial [Geminicoccaceae bacterium]